MKNLFVFAMVATALTIFNGCQKDEHVLIDEQPQAVVTNPMFVGLDTIAFSVEDNRLVFESEEEFQKCIDFLAQLGDKNFPAFEKEIGFNSYRKVFKGTNKWAKQLDDDLFATLINPEGFIQVGSFLFKIEFKNESTLVYELVEGEFDLKSQTISKTKKELVFSWDDDVFALLKNDSNLKSTTSKYCGGNQINNSFPDFINTKVEYNNYGLYHTLVARIWNGLGSQYVLNYLKLTTVDSPYNPPVVPKGITSRCFYKNKRDQGEITYDVVKYNEYEILRRPYHATRRLKGFRYDVEFWWKLNSWNSISYDHIMIECHKY